MILDWAIAGPAYQWTLACGAATTRGKFLKLVTNRGQATNTLVYFCRLRGGMAAQCPGMHDAAVLDYELVILAYLTQRKTERLQPLHQVRGGDGLRWIITIPGRCAACRDDNAPAFIVAQSRSAQARLAGQLADSHTET